MSNTPKNTTEHLIAANFKRVHEQHETRIRQTRSLEALVGRTRFGVPHTSGRLSLKVENGLLVQRVYRGDTTEKAK